MTFLTAFSTGSFFYKRDFRWTYFAASRLKKLLTSLLLPGHFRNPTNPYPKICGPLKNWSIWWIHPYWVRHIFPFSHHHDTTHAVKSRSWDSLTVISPPSELVPPDPPAFKGVVEEDTGGTPEIWGGWWVSKMLHPIFIPKKKTTYLLKMDGSKMKCHFF